MNIRNFLNDSSTDGEVRLILTTGEQLEKMIADAVEKALKGNEPKEDPIWLSSEQVCKRLKINRCTLWRWSKEGYLPGTKFGNRVRYKLSDVERVEVAEK